MKTNPKEVIDRFGNQVRTLVISALGFVTALAWNEAISSIIQTYLPAGNQWPYMLLNALIITFIAVIVIMLISKKK